MSELFTVCLQNASGILCFIGLRQYGEQFWVTDNLG